VRLARRPPGRSVVAHYGLALLIAFFAASGVSNLLLGELLGANRTVRIVAAVVAFAVFLLVELVDVSGGSQSGTDTSPTR
jgi:NADH:ubiquinone oxidoreductase subunit 6 (subunit J)